MVPQSWRVGSTEPWWRHPAQINGGHTAGNRGAQNPAYRRASHFISHPRFPHRGSQALRASSSADGGNKPALPSKGRGLAQFFAQWGACPFSSSLARATVSGWLLSSDHTGCEAISSAVLRWRARSGLLAPGSALGAAVLSWPAFSSSFFLFSSSSSSSWAIASSSQAA